MTKKAIISGVSGQDGSYLAELLLEKGYEVHGIKRRSSSLNTQRIDHIFQDPHTRNQRFFLHYGDVTDANNINQLVSNIQPDEIYNLACQSHVKVSFEIPLYTIRTIVEGNINFLEAIRTSGKNIRFYNAGSSEQFGKVKEVPQKETTPFYPRSPYACAKVFSFNQTKNYRESYNMFACSGILMNHESPRRGETFVTKKIVNFIKNYKEKKEDILYLGNLDARRDWGFAKEYVEFMWKMLQQETPDDFVIATGEIHTIREFLKEAFEVSELRVESNMKEGLEEKYYDLDTGNPIVCIDSKYFRPAEVDLLVGDASKANKILGWKPRVTFKELVKIMVREND